MTCDSNNDCQIDARILTGYDNDNIVQSKMWWRPGDVTKNYFLN